MQNQTKNLLSKILFKLDFYINLDRHLQRLDLHLQRIEANTSLPPWLHLLNQDRFRHTELLEQDRRTKEYEQAFTKRKPLISIRIATYNNSKELLDRAIPSVLKQTYKNWEMIIVGDYCTDDTRQRIVTLNDSRIRFIEMSYHYNYPKDQRRRWMAQGLLVHNEAIKHCNGDWIAPLDDDNEFFPYHLEELLKKAQRDQLELVYGNMISVDRETNVRTRVGGFPPEVGNFDFSASLYHKALKIFPFDINSHYYEEVGDTNLIRRLQESGVRIGFLNKFVTKYYFRKPGSQRTKEIFPQEQNTYDVLTKIEHIPGELSLEQADLLIKAIVDSSGHIAIIGNQNKKVSAFIKVASEKKITVVKNIFKLNDTMSNQFDLVVLNLSETENNNTSKLTSLVRPGGTIFFSKNISSILKQLETDTNFYPLQEELWMKLL